MRRIVREGERLPRGYAVAYVDLFSNHAIAYPIPLHFVVRWARDVLFFLRSVGRPSYRERVERAAYMRGLEDAARGTEKHVRRLERLSEEAWTRGYMAALRKEPQQS